MMAGFGFGSLKVDFPDKTSTALQVFYLSITSCAIGFELCAILNSATCSVFGPGKFLRGKDGLNSASQAVQVMEEKSDVTLKYFLCGFSCIVMSSILKSFILHTFWNALTVSSALILMAMYLYNVGMRIKNKLYVATSVAIKGVIERDQVVDPTNAQLM